MNILREGRDAVKNAGRKLGTVIKNAPEIGLIYNGVKFAVACVLADDIARLMGVDPTQLEIISEIESLMATVQSPDGAGTDNGGDTSLLFNLAVGVGVLATSATLIPSLVGTLAKRRSRKKSNAVSDTPKV